MEYPQVKMTTHTESFVVHYPEAQKFAETQNNVIWFDTQFNVEKDIQSFHADFNEAEQHGVKTTLKLFTHYERHIGDDYWVNCMMKWFPRPEIQRMAVTNANIEFNSHMPFYDKLNRVLGLDTDDFYLSYIDDPVLKGRMDFISNAGVGGNRLLSIATFSMAEGGILYGNFGYLKHFQANGKNKLTTVVAGINESVRDEDLHSLAGAWAFQQYRKELSEVGFETPNLDQDIYDVAEVIRQHEFAIITKLFEAGNPGNITATQMEHFVESRIDLCLQRLGLQAVYKPTYNPIKDWFYTGITGYQLHDFFRQKGREYSRNWNKTGFRWKLQGGSL